MREIVRKVGVAAPNVWRGITAENQRQLDARIHYLLDMPAAVRFVSGEPLLGPLDFHVRSNKALCLVCGEPKEAHVLCADGRLWAGLTFGEQPHVYRKDGGIDWVILGGESGPGFRPFNREWAASIIEQCHRGGAAVFVKQLGGFRPGTKLEDLPPDLRVREFPR